MTDLGRGHAPQTAEKTREVDSWLNRSRVERIAFPPPAGMAVVRVVVEEDQFGNAHSSGALRPDTLGGRLSCASSLHSFWILSSKVGK